MNKKEKTLNAKIKIIGVGGSGSNAVSRMMKCKIKGVELIVINTDIQDIRKARAHLKLRIGKKTTQGLGTGMNPLLGQKAAEESRKEIAEILKESDMVFISYGAGGGTGTGAGPIIAEIAKESGALVIAIVTKPFSFEGFSRARIAENGIKKLKEKVDTLISISNDKLVSALDPDITLTNAFWICDDTLRQAVQGISDLILLPGIVNVDFADVKAIIANAGSAFFGTGKAIGKDRAEKAVMAAINSPLLDVSIKGAKGVLFNVSGNKDISLSEIDQVAKIITQEINPEAKIIFGVVQDEKIAPYSSREDYTGLKKGEIKVTIIATGF